MYEMGSTKQSPRQARGDHAVVIGGSIAGLLTARVLADHFARVTVVERDTLPDSPQARKGAPQARHGHILLSRGQQLFEQLFPGLRTDLTMAGAPTIAAAADIAWLTPAGWAARFDSGLSMLSASRDLLEWGVRRRLARVSNVTFLTKTDVAGLATSASGKAVTGAWVRPRDEAGAMPRRLEADLVVDASGRASRAPQWLGERGFDAPEETVVESRLGYASRFCEAPAHSFGWRSMYVQASPPHQTRAGLIVPIEKGWIVMLGGRNGDHPPGDEAGFYDFARSVPCPMFGVAAKMARPRGSIAVFRATANRWRHYERLARWPERFVVLGDAACTFNPVYGQGMTTAAVGAVTLGECLARTPLAGVARRFQQALAGVNATPWLLATSEDNRFTGNGARPTWSVRLKHRYMAEVVRLGTRLPEARLALLKVLHMLEPPSALFRPWLSLRVLCSSSFRSAGRLGHTGANDCRVR